MGYSLQQLCSCGAPMLLAASVMVGVPAGEAEAAGAGGACELIWQRHQDSAFYTNAAICPAAACVFAGSYGDEASVELIPIEGDGEPAWTFTGTDFCVAAATEADVLIALDFDAAAQTITVYKWHSASATPDWSYAISPASIISGDFSLVVSADGSRAAVLVQKEPEPIRADVYCFDCSSGEMICHEHSGNGHMPLRIAISAGGDYVIYTTASELGFGWIYALAVETCNQYWSTAQLLDFAGFAGLAVSADGNYFAYDGFTMTPTSLDGRLEVRWWRDFPPGYPVYSSHEETAYMIATLAASSSFGPAVAGWLSTDEPPGASMIHRFDLPDCEDPAWTHQLSVEDGFPVTSAVSGDDSLAVVGLAETAVERDVLVFALEDSEPIGWLDTDQGIMDADIAVGAADGGAWAAAADNHNLYAARVYSQVLWVYPDGSGAYPTIQDAIDAADDGALILLADGVFTGAGNRSINFHGAAVTVRSDSGDPEACIIDVCDMALGYRGFRFESGEGPDSVVEGVTIRDGHIIALVGVPGGGAILCRNGSSPTIRDCRIIGNYANTTGGGICCVEGSSPTLIDCVITGNRAGGDGGGLCFDQSSAVEISGCTIASNRAGERGGGIYELDCFPSVFVTNGIVWGNGSDTGQGDELYCDGGGIGCCCCCVDETGIAGPCPPFLCPVSQPNIYIDPVFSCQMPFEEAPTTEGDYHLHCNSPCEAPWQPDCGRLGALGFGSACPSDVVCSGTVDVLDLLKVIGDWGPCPYPDAKRSDVNCDYQVDVLDLLAVIGGWGPCP